MMDLTLWVLQDNRDLWYLLNQRATHSRCGLQEVMFAAVHGVSERWRENEGVEGVFGGKPTGSDFTICPTTTLCFPLSGSISGQATPWGWNTSILAQVILAKNSKWLSDSRLTNCSAQPGSPQGATFLYRPPWGLWATVVGEHGQKLSLCPHSLWFNGSCPFPQ